MRGRFDFDFVIKELKEKGINGISKDDFQEFINAGINNYIYYINKEDVKIVLRIGFDEDAIPLYDKITFVCKFLRKKDLSIPKVLLIGKMRCNDGVIRPYIVQEYVEGKDLFEVKDINEYYPNIAEILAHLHQEKLTKFGHIMKKGDTCKGSHDEWNEYLFFEIEKALRHLLKEKYINEDGYEKYRSRFLKLLAKYKNVINNAKSRFLHGDIGPGNFIVDCDEKDKTIRGILDVEFASVGDPAWEFAGQRYVNEHLLKPYIEESKKLDDTFEEKDFRQKIRIHNPIKKIVITASRTKKREPKIQNYLDEIDEMLKSCCE